MKFLRVVIWAFAVSIGLINLFSIVSIHAEDVGLSNIGNSCFFNATLQALAHVKSFREVMQKIDESSIKDGETYQREMSINFIDTINNIAQINEKTPKEDAPALVKPRDLYNSMMNFARANNKDLFTYHGEHGVTGIQHDPTDVLTALIYNNEMLPQISILYRIEVLEYVINVECGHPAAPNNPNIFNSIILALAGRTGDINLLTDLNSSYVEGVIEPESEKAPCHWCTALALNEKKFWDNSKDIKKALDGGVFNEEILLEIVNDKRYDCFRKYKILKKELANFKGEAARREEKRKPIEQLETTDNFKTIQNFIQNFPDCDLVLRTLKKIKKICNTPKFIIVTYLRFFAEYNDRTGEFEREKVDLPISFPSSLDLASYMKAGDKHFIYKLKSFICHDGSIDGGHHYAFGWSDKANCWYELSDSYVAEVNINSYIKNNKAAFILFYEREDTLQPNLDKLKTMLKELKTKLQSLRDKLRMLKSKGEK